jgi:hypothetical protein
MMTIPLSHHTIPTRAASRRKAVAIAFARTPEDRRD